MTPDPRLWIILEESIRIDTQLPALKFRNVLLNNRHFVLDTLADFSPICAPQGNRAHRSSTHTRHTSSRRVSIQARGGVVSERVTTNNSAGCWRSLDTTVSLVLTHRGHRQSSSNACPCGKKLKLGKCPSPRVGASWQQSSTSTGAPSFQPQRFFPPFPSFTRLLQFPPSK